MSCFFCGGSAHPAVGCSYSSSVISCRRCTEEFWVWFRGHMRKWGRPGVPDFYAAASKFAPTARSDEQAISNRKVEGSSPSRRATSR